MSPHLRAVLQALLVTVLWSTSWVLIKIGLAELPALTFAGLRYLLAWTCLLPVALVAGPVRSELRAVITGPDRRRRLGLLVALGLTLYTVTQGAQFLALDHLPAQTASLLWSFSTVVVAVSGTALLAERPTARQWGGIALYLTGAAIFLHPVTPGGARWLGILIAVTGVLANASAAVIGRAVNRRSTLTPLTVTVVSMGVGSAALLASGIMAQGVPSPTRGGWLIIAWVAVVNTAAAFVLWNLTQRTLSATESSVINSTMLIQIPVLAWLFLDEALGARQVTGLSLAAAGVLLVQLRTRRVPWTRVPAGGVAERPGDTQEGSGTQNVSEDQPRQ